MLQDPNVERYIQIAVKPLKKEIEQMKAQIEALNQALRIHDVVSRRELLLDFAEYSENDKTSTAIDECVDNYLDSIKQ
jgi:acetolactate synthase small subunit